MGSQRVGHNWAIELKIKITIIAIIIILCAEYWLLKTIFSNKMTGDTEKISPTWNLWIPNIIACNNIQSLGKLMRLTDGGLLILMKTCQDLWSSTKCLPVSKGNVTHWKDLWKLSVVKAVIFKLLVLKYRNAMLKFISRVMPLEFLIQEVTRKAGY